MNAESCMAAQGTRWGRVGGRTRQSRPPPARGSILIQSGATRSGGCGSAGLQPKLDLCICVSRSGSAIIALAQHELPRRLRRHRAGRRWRRRVLQPVGHQRRRAQTPLRRLLHAGARNLELAADGVR